jgi:superoxide reductase
MKVFVCSVCGHIEFDQIPGLCPVCKSPKEKYSQKDRIFEESAEKSKEAAEKHIPVVMVSAKCGLIPEQTCLDINVRIGSKLHPMENAHYIQFIDCYVDNRYVSRIFLTPGVFAAGSFHLKTTGVKVAIVENCNIHGYWKSETNL